MVRICFALTVVVFAGYASSRPADEFTANKAKELIPEAAGMSAKELRDIAQSPNPSADFKPKNGYSLTWAVLNYAPGADTPKNPTSFKFADEAVNPAKLAEAICGPKNMMGKHRENATIIQPEYITDCTCKVDGDTATGTVSFKADRVYEGQVEYTARKKDGKWRIEEFRLPDVKITVGLDTEGKWVKK